MLGAHTSSSSSSDGDLTSRAVFYGVFIPMDAVLETNENSSAAANGAAESAEVQSVYTDKQEVLKVVKKFRGARFKAFRNRDDAIHFSKFPADQSSSATTATALSPSLPSANVSSPAVGLDAKATSLENASLERGTAFRGPKAQELVKLRKAIESGDAEFFRQTVWANPRYLISSGDTPTILQEGPRYNALHVVAKAKQSTMCQLILDTIENVNFMQLLYNDDSPNTTLHRMNFLVDLYINMPDKALCETPLHFATKFGCLKVVEVLASHPACVKNVQNKYNQTPKDVICSRCSAPCSELKRQIEGALEGQYFVPVMGDRDNSRQPYVGEPWSPCKMFPPPPPLSDDVLKIENIPERTNLLVSTPFVRACAGPMSPKQAEEFHHRWKTPPFSKTILPASPWTGRARLMGIRLTDTDKGLERIGRELARESNIPWNEHWSFLDTYCDLTKPDGLNKLETYLRNKYNELTLAQAKWDALSQDSPVFDESGIDESLNCGFDSSSVFDDLSGSVFSSGGSLGSLCSKFTKMTINSNPTMPYIRSSNVSRKTVQRPFQVIEKENKEEKEQEEALEMPLLGDGRRASIVLDNVCHDIATRLTRELYEQAVRQFEFIGKIQHALKRDLTKKMRPSIECLVRLARHSSSPFTRETEPHVVIANHVLSHLREDLSDEQITASLRSMTALNDSDILSSDDDSSEDDKKNRYCFTASVPNTKSQAVVRQHLKCILGLLVSMMVTKENENIDSQCNHNNLSAAPINSKCQAVIIDRRFSNESSSSTDSTYHTPPSSIVTSDGSSSDIDARTPDEGLLVFINGGEPTKLDVDVLRALNVDGCTVDPVLYPHIYRWMHLVTSYSREETENWPTPMSARNRAGGNCSNLQPRRAFSTPSRMSTPDAMKSPSSVPHQRLQSTTVFDSPSSDNGRSVQTNLYDSIFQNLVNE